MDRVITVLACLVVGIVLGKAAQHRAPVVRYTALVGLVLLLGWIWFGGPLPLPMGV